VIAGAVDDGALDDDGLGSAVAGTDVAASLLDDDKGSFDISDVDVAGFDEWAGLVFSSLRISDVFVVARGGEDMGVVGEIDASMRTCDPAPSPFEVWSSFISTAIVDGLELGRSVPCSTPVDWFGDAIGRGFWGEMDEGLLFAEGRQLARALQEMDFYRN
jgi:hypothetical protein